MENHVLLIILISDNSLCVVGGTYVCMYDGSSWPSSEAELVAFSIQFLARIITDFLAELTVFSYYYACPVSRPCPETSADIAVMAPLAVSWSHTVHFCGPFPPQMHTNTRKIPQICLYMPFKYNKMISYVCVNCISLKKCRISCLWPFYSFLLKIVFCTNYKLYDTVKQGMGNWEPFRICVFYIMWVLYSILFHFPFHLIIPKCLSLFISYQAETSGPEKSSQCRTV